jgi:hypothetical protein
VLVDAAARGLEVLALASLHGLVGAFGQRCFALALGYAAGVEWVVDDVTHRLGEPRVALGGVYSALVQLRGHALCGDVTHGDAPDDLFHDGSFVGMLYGLAVFGVTPYNLAGSVHLLGRAINPSKWTLAAIQRAAVALVLAAIGEAPCDLLALPAVEE